MLCKVVLSFLPERARVDIKPSAREFENLGTLILVWLCTPFPALDTGYVISASSSDWFIVLLTLADWSVR